MVQNHAHVVQLHLTPEEWRVISAIASLRRISVEDLLREGLRLNRREAPEGAPHERTPHLHLVTSDS